MSEVMVYLYDTWGHGSYVAFARVRKYKRKEGFRVEVLHKYFSGSWRTVAKGVVSTIEEAAEFIAKNSLANKGAVLKELREKFGEVRA